MIVEQRIYELRPGATHEFLALYEAEGLAVQLEAYGNLIGYFSSEVGELNRVIHLWGFDSFEERARRRSALSADPRWRAFLGKAGGLLVTQRNELLIPASFSPIK